MASVTDTGDTNSWLRQKSTLFNNNTNITKSPKVLDKELAQLKNRGVVSSVWSNKFVQNSSSGDSPSTQPPAEPLSPRRLQQQRNISPRPNAAYIPVAPGSRQTFDNYALQIQPTSPTFSALEKQRARTLSGTGRMAQDIKTVLNKRATDLDNNQTQSNLSSKMNKNNSSVSSFELTEDEADNRFSVGSATSTPRSTLTKSEIVKPSASTPLLALSSNASRSSLDNTTAPVNTKTDSLDTEAALWFEIETLKTRYAQSEARLKKASEDIDFYKRQLEFQADSIKEATEEKDEAANHLKNLAQLIVKQDQLLIEYENKLQTLSSFSSSNGDTVMVDELRKELDELTKKKNYMEGAISAMQGELEMSNSQMRLMMVVSTEIQDEFEAFKEKSQKNLDEALNLKQVEHNEEMDKLRRQMNGSSSISSDNISATRDIQNNNDNKQELDSLLQQVAQLTKALKDKDNTIQDLEMKLKTQKMDMESQLMALNKTIVDKDSLFLEMMSARNNSEISLFDHATLSPPDSAYQSEKRYVDAESYTKAHLQFEEMDNYIVSSDDEDMSNEGSRYDNTHRNSTPQSPADSESSMLSSLTFESASEEKVAEIKHFSYTSVQSQSVIPRPISDVSTLDALAHENTSKSLTPFLAKENSASNNSKWPMPPPTPPPSEPLPPVPPVPAVGSALSSEQVPIITTAVPPPRRGRSNTLVRSDTPEISTKNLDISRTTLSSFENQRPIPPPRKALSSRDSLTLRSPTSSLSKHTKWMDDPEEGEDEDEEQWSMAQQQWTAY